MLDGLKSKNYSVKIIFKKGLQRVLEIKNSLSLAFKIEKAPIKKNYEQNVIIMVNSSINVLYTIPLITSSVW